MFKPSKTVLPWFIKGGKNANDLKTIVDKIWQNLFYDSLNKLAKYIFLNSNPSNASIDFKLNEYGEIKTTNAREFLKNFRQDSPKQKLNATQTMFNLSLFEVELLGRKNSAYPWYYMRIFISPTDAATLKELRKYLKGVVPARCYFMLEIIQADITNPFNIEHADTHNGLALFGRKFGR